LASILQPAAIRQYFRLCEHNLDRGIVHQVAQSFLGQSRIQGHVGGAGEQHPQYAYDLFPPFMHENRNTGIGLSTPGAQILSEPGGAA
jgi:hypothetical protein